MTRLSHRDSLNRGRVGQALAVALIICVLAGLWFGFAKPLREWHSRRGQLLQQLRTLERFMTNVTETSRDLEKGLANTAENASARAIFPGDTDSVTGAALQDLVQGMIAQSGAALNATEVVPVIQLGAYRRIGVRVYLHAPRWSVVVRLLESLERADPYLLVDDLRAHATPTQTVDHGSSIETQFIVYAFRAATAPKRSD